MVQLSIINPQHILPTFARLKFFYAKYPIINDFLSLPLVLVVWFSCELGTTLELYLLRNYIR